MISPVVLFAAGREPTYVRNSLILRALRERFSVVERVSRARTYSRRFASILPSLATGSTHSDVTFAGFFGQPLAIWMHMLGLGPIVLDAFVSAFDTLCMDRRRFPARSPLGLAAYSLDSLACRSAAIVTVDTYAQADYFVETFRIPRERVRTVYLGYDDTICHSASGVNHQPSGFNVLFYSSYLPLHGVDIIVRAANLLRSERQITFILVGQGMMYPAVRKLTAHLGLENIRFCEWLPYETLGATIANADICLGGHFGVSSKAGRVIAGKTFQCIAAGKPTIVGDGPANYELFRPGQHAWFCSRGSPRALAEAILTLYRDTSLREYLATEGQALVRTHFGPDQLADHWAKTVHEALSFST